MYVLAASLGDLRRFIPFIDPYACLEDMFTKKRGTTFFDHSFNFSLASDKFKRALIILVVFLLVFSYLHYYEMHAQAHDKLLRALTVHELETYIFSAVSYTHLTLPTKRIV